MFPTSNESIAGFSNAVFFVNNSASVAFNAFPIERELISVFNPSGDSVYLGDENVTSANHLYEALPGKLSVFEVTGTDAIYAVSDSPDVAVVYGSQYY